MPETHKRRRLSDSGSFKSDSGAEIENGKMEVNGDAQPTPKKSQNRTLFVRSLPPSATTETLTEFFSQSYPLKHATVVLDPKTKQSKGFGFVTFTDHEDAQRALEELNGSAFEGRKIKIEVAEARHRDVGGREGKAGSSENLERLKESKERRKQEAQPPKLIIRNLPWSITEPEQLELLFRSYGKVKHSVIPKKSSRHAGFGFVVMRGKKNAEKAIAGVNGKEVDGRALAVDWAVEKSTWDDLNKAQDEAQGESGAEPEADKAEPGDKSDDASMSDADGGELEHIDDDDDDDDNEEDEEDEDEEMDEEDEEEDDGEDNAEDERNACTIFIRNLPFSATDETLYEQFKQFGPLRYARVVMDHETGRPRGTAFVCFWNVDDARLSLREAPKSTDQEQGRDAQQKSATKQKHSVLENEHNDPSGKYTMDGRVLQLSQAVTRRDAVRLEAEGSSKREVRDKDKRRLYLLSEGTIPSNSPLYSKLSATEVKMREASTKQRQKLIKTSPMLHISLTRLSIRNIPRHIDSKALKALAREGVVGFAKDVKHGLRQPLSKEELQRNSETMKEAENLRKLKGKGIVKQAKVVFEGKDGGKIPEKSGAGRSRGYGFIEYTTHRSALMGLRWLNGHAIGSSSSTDVDPEDRKRRLIVEFAIENAQVINRRRDNELKLRREGKPSGGFDQGKHDHIFSLKRKRSEKSAEERRERKRPGKKPSGEKAPAKAPPAKTTKAADKDNQVAKRNRIIAKKRMMRRTRKG